MNITKGSLVKSSMADETAMELINNYTRKPFLVDDVYIFSVTLCDNQVDRDFEAFSTESLLILKDLFLGKTGILDHDPSSKNQTARIFNTYLVEENEKNFLGEPYVKLVADAYIPRNKSYEDIIEKIDAGILKEVSVGCSVKKSVCSICEQESCSHIKGDEYGGETCVKILDEPTDAYEFSFVAIPAQRGAGVNKNYGEGKTVTEKIKNLKQGQELTLTFDELKDLRKSAQWGESYRENLCKSVKKLSRIIQPSLGESVVESITNNLDFGELVELEKAYSHMASENLPLKPQLVVAKETTSSNQNFKI